MRSQTFEKPCLSGHPVWGRPRLVYAFQGFVNCSLLLWPTVYGLSFWLQCSLTVSLYRSGAFEGQVAISALLYPSASISLNMTMFQDTYIYQMRCWIYLWNVSTEISPDSCNNYKNVVGLSKSWFCITYYKSFPPLCIIKYLGHHRKVYNAKILRAKMHGSGISPNHVISHHESTVSHCSQRPLSFIKTTQSSSTSEASWPGSMSSTPHVSVPRVSA